MKKVWLVWGVGVFAYVIAVLHRTSFGVSGLSAADRFSISPSVLSSFVVLQIVVYAGMQIPAGVLLDRYGSRIMIAVGAFIMMSAQLALAFTESLPVAIGARIAVGAGDALTFISVLRLVPQWFPPRQVPLVSQFTGILGQLGQVMSALPFMLLLSGPGWTFAYGSAAAVGLLAFALALSVIRDAPPGADLVAVPAGAKEIGRQIKTVWMRPGTRLGFFSHMGTQFSITTFALLWGVPYLKSAQGLDSTTVGSLLTLSVISAIVAGPILGILTGRYPMRRSWLVLTIMVASALMWTIVLSRSEPSPLWLLTILVVVISVGGPGSVIGFDYARTSNPSSAMGTAQGMVNIGGFLASLIVIQVMGVILGHMGGYTFDGFRVAWMVQYPVWILGIVGVLVTRGKARRALAAEGVHVRPIREVIRRNK
ncbi:MFS transporter [Rhodococcus qingshengii]|jgi:MFS family permease|uniref:MFS transporter n=1 Tax=Rhodococcus TaxID=1827 RepID=UPI0001A32B28|nr:MULTISPECIES: MFS transporter [Rhodococcus]EEN90292.1 transporter, major facilitator family protein [Rhodococcus erythropolis SK121]MYV25635.1 MFS transporter [Rhodococcus erythropolis]AZI64052.1 MFS transporter [Rhodococcus sp. NJ-530]MBQ7808390.1 MFS transporter [Rhodococcus sp. (in: high G+C Gram-positive bacteria)]MBS3691683.1 MFS transporter [Rhodococcus qingshengii]